MFIVGKFTQWKTIAYGGATVRLLLESVDDDKQIEVQQAAELLRPAPRESVEGAAAVEAAEPVPEGPELAAPEGPKPVEAAPEDPAIAKAWFDALVGGLAVHAIKRWEGPGYCDVAGNLLPLPLTPKNIVAFATDSRISVQVLQAINEVNSRMVAEVRDAGNVLSSESTGSAAADPLPIKS